MPIARKGRAGWVISSAPVRLFSPEWISPPSCKRSTTAINVSISWLWDGGIDVRLGDAVNGFLAEEMFANAAEIAPWLQQAVAHFYPNSTYAQSLDPEVKQLAAQRLFRPPTTGLSVRCPHCGAPNAAPPGMEELMAFVCSNCGQRVTVEPPKIHYRQD